ncbi:hypothetical protein Q3G72_022271 [Acer saccharum]|nr:hypothetical protein Q3G72_022271 [Acer saccharum]
MGYGEEEWQTTITQSVSINANVGYGKENNGNNLANNDGSDYVGSVNGNNSKVSSFVFQSQHEDVGLKDVNMGWLGLRTEDLYDGSGEREERLQLYLNQLMRRYWVNDDNNLVKKRSLWV